MEGFSLKMTEREFSELQKDLEAFTVGYDAVRRRIQECLELDPPRSPQLHDWSGTSAVLGSLELSIHAIERTISGYREILEKLRSGEIPNTDPPEPGPTLKLV